MPIPFRNIIEGSGSSEKNLHFAVGTLLQSLLISLRKYRQNTRFTQTKYFIEKNHNTLYYKHLREKREQILIIVLF